MAAEQLTISGDIIKALEELKLLQFGKANDDDFLILPDSMNLHDLEKYKTKPRRKTGLWFFNVAGDFSQFVTEQRGQHISLMLDHAAATLEACLDFHQDGPTGDAGFRDFHAVLKLEFDRDWKRLTAQDDKWFSQSEFADFVEDHLHLIATPDSATILEMAQDLVATQKMNFKSAQRQKDGDRSFLFETETTGKIGKKEIVLPDRIVWKLPVFWRHPAVTIQSLLRYRVSADGVLFKYRLHRPDDARDTILDQVQLIIEKATSEKVFSCKLRA